MSQIIAPFSPRSSTLGVAALAVAALAISAGALPAHAATLNGRYKTPLGEVKVVERNGTVRATAVGKNACGFRRNKLVFEGTRLDDSVTGTIHACKLGPGCSGKVSGLMMLLVTREGKTLSGAVHLDAGTCKTPLKGDGVTISLLEAAGETKRVKIKSKGRSATKKITPKRSKDKPLTLNDDEVPPPSSKSALEQAEAIATEGHQLLKVGKIEEAREKFSNAVVVAPEYANGYLGVGVTYYLRGRYGEAMDQYKLAIEAAPANGDTYYNMACVYALQDKKELAFRYLSIAVLNSYVDETFVEDEDLASLRSDPRWEQIKLGIPVESNPEPPAGDDDGRPADGTAPASDTGAADPAPPDPAPPDAAPATDAAPTTDAPPAEAAPAEGSKGGAKRKGRAKTPEG